MGKISFVGFGLAGVAHAGTTAPDTQLPAKGLALLCYLALHPQPQTRSHLAGLLWGDLSETLARTNLRLTLHKLRKSLAEQLDIGRETVAFMPDLDSDIAAFERLVAGGTLPELERAAALYTGELLAGLDLSGAPDFELWLAAERERLRELARRTLVTLAERAGGEQAQAYALRALAIAPWDESAHLRLIQLHLDAGDSSAALAQCDTLKTTLARELGAQPSAAALRLFAEADRRRQALQLATAHTLPEPATPFVGRSAERAAIHDLFDRKICRLVTLTGLGGIGKSRLAIATAAERRDRYRDGVTFVSLVGVHPKRDEDARDLVLVNLAAALGFAFNGTLKSNATPQDQLTDFLRGKRGLIVIDNFEQVRAAAPLLAQLIEAAPGLHMLVTSRERLGLMAEHVIDIGGLAFSPGNADSDARRLFCDTARRVMPGFDADAARADIDALCAHVEGVPLCLELAANWARALSCAEILARLRADARLLDASGSHWPDRHRSMHRVIDASWRMLSYAEQFAFRRLTLFQGGFDVGAGLALAQTSLATLSGLVDKSWLKRDASGRFRIHELLRQFGAEQLRAAPGELAETESAHALYFRTALREALVAGQLRERAALVADRENLRAAWYWHLRAGHAVADSMLPDLWRYYDSTASYQDAVLMLQGALALDGSPQALRVRWTRLLGEAHYQTGAASQGRAFIEDALTMLDVPIGRTRRQWMALLVRGVGEQAVNRLLPRSPVRRAQGVEMLLEACAGLRQLMHIYYFRGDEVPMAALIFRYLNMAERSGDADEMAFGYAAASIAFGSIDSYVLADRYDRLAQTHVAHSTDPMMTARALQASGVYAVGAGRLAQAKPILERAREMFDRTGGYRYYTECEEMLCEIAFYTGDYGTALRLASSQPLHSANDPLALAISAYSRAATKLRTGDDLTGEQSELHQLKLDALETSDHVCVFGTLARTYAMPNSAHFDADRARHFAQKAIAAARRTKMPAIYSIEAYGLLSDALLDLCATQTRIDPTLMRETDTPVMRCAR